MRVAKKCVAAVLVALLVLTVISPLTVMAQADESAGAKPASKFNDSTVGMIVLSVAIVVGSSCVAAGIAVARVGSAALGAASERPELLGRSLILVGLAEGIAIYGLIIGIMLLGLIK